MAFTVEIRHLPVRPAVGLLHKGGFNEIGETFERLFSLLGAHGLTQHVRGPFGRYRDGPDGIPVEDLRSHACAFTDVSLTPAFADGILHGRRWHLCRADLQGTLRGDEARL